MTARVLFCRSNPISPDPRVEKQAHALYEAGYHVFAVAWDRTGQLLPSEKIGDIQCFRLLIRARYAHGMGNIFGLLRWQWGLLVWLLRKHSQFDVIHACDFDTILPALFCKYYYGKLVIYDVFDFYADHLRATPRFIKNIIRRVDRKVMDKVDALILADDARLEQIAGVKPKRVEVIYNTPQDTLDLIEDDEGKGESRLFTISYVGLMQVERGLIQLLEVLGRHPDWELSLAGFGGDMDQILARAETCPNVTWYGRVPYDLAIKLNHRADVLIATYDPSIPNHRYSSPNKIFEAMMLAKPIIVARNTHMDRIIESAHCGMVVDYGVVPALEMALKELAQDAQLRWRLGRNARQAYEMSYSWNEMKARLNRLYREVVGPPQPALAGDPQAMSGS